MEELSISIAVLKTLVRRINGICCQYKKIRLILEYVEREVLQAV